MPDSPVTVIATDDAERSPEAGTALCLSGGGYRAMLFHLGALWRLYDSGVLVQIKRISSVSGGSITAGVLAMKWKELSFNSGASDDFVAKVVAPVRGLAGESIDREAIAWGLVLPGRIGDRIAAAYDEHLFRGATLQDLPDQPRFVINATNVQSGVLWRFSKPYMRDYRVGEVKNPTLPLAQAVAASSAFPPALSPFELRLDPRAFTPNSGQDLQRDPFTRRVLLTDGGVYDNLGLETVWKRYDTVLVSDGGGQMAPEEEPHSDWARHSYRVLNLVDNQVRALRKRQVIESYRAGSTEANNRMGAYWGIRTDITNYGVAHPLPAPHARSIDLAELPTRLKRMPDDLQERLINWGYAVCDAALRKHVDPSIARPGSLPYPDAGV
jgi:NTE family protein